MNNAFFGKTIENARKRRLIDIVQTSDKLKKRVAHPTYKSITIFNEGLSSIERLKSKVKMDKPIYIYIYIYIYRYVRSRPKQIVDV